MNFLISDIYKEAVGMTLLHSLWQGAIWSMVLLLARQAFKDANRRYFAGLITFGGFFLGVALTMYLIWPQMNASTTNESFTILLSDTAVPAERLGMDLHFLMPWFINFWLIGTLLFVLRMVAGFHYLGRLTALSQADVPLEWDEKIRQIAADLGINRGIRVLGSVHVDMPMIYGHIRPVLLLPVTLLSGLSATQLEAIFAHELAHIRRHDFLVNILQRSVEAIFFFNPFVWWISKMINNERERCCDDLAVAYCSDRRLYVEALSSLETYRVAGSGLAMGLSADKGDLLHRIRRLLEPDYRQGGNYRLVVLAFVFTAALIGFNFISVTPEDAEAQKEKVLPARVDMNLRPAPSLVQADTTKPESKKKSVKALKAAEPTVSNVQFSSLDTLDFKFDFSTIEDIDFEPIMMASIEAVQNIDVDFSHMADVNIDVAFEAMEDIDFDQIMGSVQVALDTNILRRDTTWTRLNQEQREELRRAREEIRRAQLELREMNREQMMEIREHLREQQAQMREQWEQIREQVREEFERNGGKISDEERVRIQREMEIAQKQISEEMQIVQKQMSEQIQIQQKMVAKEMAMAEKELERAQLEMERAQVEMQRHNQFQSQIEQMLRKDDYLKAGEKLTRLKVSKDSFRFNNRKVEDKDLDKYLKVFREYFGSIGSGTYEYNE